MTGQDFRQQHGDPAQWTDTEYELFAAIAKPATEPLPISAPVALPRPTT